MEQTQQFPAEEVILPSKGLLYPEESPLKSGIIEMKYMTAKEEDILTNANFIQNGTVIDKLLQSLIVTKFDYNDLLIGDKNAILVAARILAYGPDYTAEVTNPNNPEQKVEHTFDLTACPFKTLPDDVNYTDNSFDYTTEVGKTKIKFKLLTGTEEALIEKDLKQSAKFGYSSDITTRLRYTITEVDGDNKPETINSFSQNMLARDSVALRNYIQSISPDIDLTSEIEIGGETVSVSIPLTVEFFWPKTV